MNDALGARMKGHYELRTQSFLPRRTYTIVRVDGRAFHTYCRKLDKPYDCYFHAAMDIAALELCQEMMGCRLAYIQSDEASFLITDFATNQTQAWFDGKIQKITSIAASIFTAAFLKARFSIGDCRLANFDARVFSIPERAEVINYFRWRQIDATRNSLNLLASVHYSPKQLHAKSEVERHEMLYQKGVNWASLPAFQKHGRCITQIPTQREVTFTHKKTEQQETIQVMENAWRVDPEIPVFTRPEGLEYLGKLIPQYE